MQPGKKGTVATATSVMSHMLKSICCIPKNLHQFFKQSGFLSEPAANFTFFKIINHRYERRNVQFEVPLSISFDPSPSQGNEPYKSFTCRIVPQMN